MPRQDIFDPNFVEVPQGNTKELDITPIDIETLEPVILEEGDVVLFTVVNRRGEKVIQKRLTHEDYSDPEDTSINCTIEPDDTINLLTGWYSYDCLALLAGGRCCTFIENSPFLITKSFGKYTDILQNPDSKPDDSSDFTEENQNGGDSNG